MITSNAPIKISIPTFRQMTRDLICWIQGTESTPDKISTWTETHWQTARQVIFMQGVGPYLHWRLSQLPDGAKIAEKLPAELTDWLAVQYENNRVRNARMLDELSAILRVANREGIEVMPLKGALLAKEYYSHAALRPMADLDILVKSEDRHRMGKALVELGYQQVHERIPDYYRDKYIQAGDDKIASLTGESPDNPRPLELHHELRRPMWGDVGVTDLTDKLWGEGRSGEYAGQPVRLPSRSGLVQHLLLHAMEHFIICTGRILMWLDIAALKPQLVEIADQENQQAFYPILRLAQRALPSRLDYLNLEPLAQCTPDSVRRWSDSVPLDDRCGLTSLPQINRSWLRWRWLRWRPEPWRLSLAYGEERYPNALRLHTAAFIRKLGVVARRSLWESHRVEDQ